jgi:pyruvate formate lyase activating enzyme
MVHWIGEKLGPDVPIHFTRFHPMYKLTNLPSTPVEILTRNWEIAKAAGLHYPYVGNVMGHPAESTHCPACGALVIERYGFAVRPHWTTPGHCPGCKKPIAGVWT